MQKDELVNDIFNTLDNIDKTIWNSFVDYYYEDKDHSNVLIELMIEKFDEFFNKKIDKKKFLSYIKEFITNENKFNKLLEAKNIMQKIIIKFNVLMERIHSVNLLKNELEYATILYNITNLLAKAQSDELQEIFESTVFVNYDLINLIIKLSKKINSSPKEVLEQIKKETIKLSIINNGKLKLDRLQTLYNDLLEHYDYLNLEDDSEFEKRFSLLNNEFTKIKKIPYINEKLLNEFLDYMINSLQTLSNAQPWINLCIALLFEKNDLIIAKKAIVAFKSADDNKDEYIGTIIENLNNFINDYNKKLLKLNKIPQEAPEEEIINKYAFADQRKNEVPPEPNNDVEQYFYDKLSGHFSSNSPISIKDTDTLRQILKQKLYKSIIHELTKTLMYRGMSVSSIYLKKLLGLTKNDKLPELGAQDIDFTFEPKEGSGLSSWTESRSAAFLASKIYNTDYPYTIVMVANTNDNPNRFIDCNNGLYNVKGFDSYEHEREVLGLGNIQLSKVFWQKRKE